MKISERKQRLRARGIVPVAQVPAQEGRTPVVTRATTTRKGAAAREAPPRRRRQISPGYQIILGGAYMIFAPILLVQYIALLHAPHSKVHLDGWVFLQFIGMPVIFFLFGAWWVYRGLRARRRNAADGPAPLAGGQKSVVRSQ